MSTGLPIAALQWWAHRRWIPFGVRDRALRAFAHPESVSSTPFECDFFGLWYRGDLASFIDWNVCFYGGYELGVLALLRDIAAVVGRDAVALDIGANTGQHTLFLSRFFAHVHAFEPWAGARERLEANVATNRLHNVTIYPVGLGDQNESRSFYAPASTNLGTGSFLANVNDNLEAGALEVVRGDSLLQRRGVRRVDLIKIDTEGFEARVLRGLEATLENHRPIVVFEASPPAVAEIAAKGSLERGLAELFGSGWRFFDLGSDPESYSLSPVSDALKSMAMMLAAPDELSGRLPRRGGWRSERPDR